jgi:hypothetical protein
VASEGSGSAVLYRLEGVEMANKTTRTEEFELDGEEVLGKVKSLLREGNIRRIVLKNEKGKVLIEIPLTVGLVGAALAPALIAVGAVAAAVGRLTVAVERVQK